MNLIKNRLKVILASIPPHFEKFDPQPQFVYQKLVPPLRPVVQCPVGLKQKGGLCVEPPKNKGRICCEMSPSIQNWSKPNLDYKGLLKWVNFVLDGLKT